MKRALVAVVLLVACGRTAEPDTADVACEADLTGSCPKLAAARHDLEKSYVKTLSGKGADAERGDAIGACAHDVVEQEIASGCLADDAARCSALCELHPCALKVGVLAACPDACADIAQDEKVSADALDAALLLASDHPGLCTCQVCEGDAGKLCNKLWQCSAP